MRDALRQEAEQLLGTHASRRLKSRRGSVRIRDKRLRATLTSGD
jgi:hypothetical protein